MGCLRLPLPSIARDIGESLSKTTYILISSTRAHSPNGRGEQIRPRLCETTRGHTQAKFDSRPWRRRSEQWVGVPSRRRGHRCFMFHRAVARSTRIPKRLHEDKSILTATGAPDAAPSPRYWLLTGPGAGTASA